jgi:hypothetical protein
MDRPSHDEMTQRVRAYSKFMDFKLPPSSEQIFATTGQELMLPL